MPHNIERSVFRKGEYHGTGNGFNWRIRRNVGYERGDYAWVATCSVGACYARTLADIGAKISDPKHSCS